MTSCSIVSNIPPVLTQEASHNSRQTTAKLHTRSDTIVSRAPPQTKVLWQVCGLEHLLLCLSTETRCLRASPTKATLKLNSEFNCPPQQETRKNTANNVEQRYDTMINHYDYLSWIHILSHSGGVRVNERMWKRTDTTLDQECGTESNCVSRYTLQCPVIVDNN